VFACANVINRVMWDPGVSDKLEETVSDDSCIWPACEKREELTWIIMYLTGPVHKWG